jgi:ABC-type sulfate transport system substrate-binding protein
MKKQLQDKLFADFPKLFVQKDLDKKATCMCWGIECPDAWYDAIHAACHCIQTMTDINKHISDKYPQVEFTQVKEKFGALCMYNNVNSDYVNGVIDMADTMVQQMDKNNKVNRIYSHHS